MTRLIVVKCPQCGADLQIEADRKTAYCTYCGAKILIENENEYIYRNIDEAAVRKAEADEKVKLKALELDEQEDRRHHLLVLLWVGSIAILILLGIMGFANGNGGMMMCLILGMMDGAYGFVAFDDYHKQGQDRRAARSGKIKLASASFERKNVHSVENMLRTIGFTNIQLLNMEDLMTGWLYKPDMVSSVTIGGRTAEAGKWYFPDDKVVISYHDFGK